LVLLRIQQIIFYFVAILADGPKSKHTFQPMRNFLISPSAGPLLVKLIMSQQVIIF